MKLPRWTAVAALALSAACGTQSPPPNVLVIVLDTVRADHLSCYGYPRPTTPRIDALAAGADRYTRARSTAPWTLPSHASLFTGKFPHEHGADARKTVQGQFFDSWPLDANEWTLAEALAAEGYRTAAFVANAAYVNERHGLAQGFEVFKSEKMRAPDVLAAALAWIQGGQGDAARKPYFLFLNFMDAHRKYNVAPLAPERAAQLPAVPTRDVGELLDELVQTVLATENTPSEQLVSDVIDAYDLGLANADHALGQLFDALRAAGTLDNTLIVITSDHGEYFGEHDLVEHSKDVYEPVLSIPLIVKRPAQSAGRVLDAPLSIADVPRIVFESLPQDKRASASRFPGSSPERGLLAELRYTRSKDMGAPYGKRFDRERAVFYSNHWKLIRSSDGQHELYDLSKDPRELANLFTERADEAKKLMARLHALTLNRRTYEGDPIPPPLTADELRTLRETGYAGDVDDVK